MKKNTTKIRTYGELIQLPTFKERFEYLRLDGVVGEQTFGAQRYLNQKFYQKSPEWKRIRRKVIMRDMGRDMALEGYDIFGTIIVHHLNPITLDDINNLTDLLLNPDYLVCVKPSTHNAIHYGDETVLRTNVVVERKPNDTCPWRKQI